MNERELLIETTPFIPPASALAGLSSTDAFRQVPGAPHGIAEIVAHLTFWQEWFTRRAQGAGDPMARHAADGWPAVAPDSWEATRERFLSGLERLVSLAADAGAGPVAPPIEFPPLAAYRTRDVLVHVAMHNAHHLGQVVLLRQQLGCWPPPAGSYTW